MPENCFLNGVADGGGFGEGFSFVFFLPLLKRPASLCAIAAAALATGCSQSSDVLDSVTTSSIAKREVAYSMKDRECLARAMFFESHRSSREGLVAVGTVVINRVRSDDYPDTICGVVGQKNQFAPGVMTRRMDSKAMPDVMAAADAVLAGERHPLVQNAKFFHQAGLSFPYPNMHYVLKAGGNSFYEKRGRTERATNGVRPQSQLAAAGRVEGAQPQSQQLAATSATLDPQVNALSYDVASDKVDAIGALILDQTRTASID